MDWKLNILAIFLLALIVFWFGFLIYKSDPDFHRNRLKKKQKAEANASVVAVVNKLCGYKRHHYYDYVVKFSDGTSFQSSIEEYSINKAIEAHDDAVRVNIEKGKRKKKKERSQLKHFNFNNFESPDIKLNQIDVNLLKSENIEDQLRKACNLIKNISDEKAEGNEKENLQKLNSMIALSKEQFIFLYKNLNDFDIKILKGYFLQVVDLLISGSSKVSSKLLYVYFKDEAIELNDWVDSIEKTQNQNIKYDFKITAKTIKSKFITKITTCLDFFQNKKFIKFFKRFLIPFIIVLAVLLCLIFIPTIVRNISDTYYDSLKVTLVNPNSSDMYFGNKRFLKADSESNQKIIWSSSDESIATVDQNGVVTAKNKWGTVTIKASGEKCEGDTVTFKVTAKPQNIDNSFINYPIYSVSKTTIKISSTDPIYIIFQSNSNSDNTFSILIDGVSEFRIPCDTYRLYYATGKIWYGEYYHFGPDTSYYKRSSFLNVECGFNYTLSLLTSFGSNSNQISIEKNEFPG